jgi:alanine racemase
MVRLGIDCTAFQMMPNKNNSKMWVHLNHHFTNRTISAGESVGYGRRFVANKPTKIATIPMDMQMDF